MQASKKKPKEARSGPKKVQGRGRGERKGAGAVLKSAQVGDKSSNRMAKDAASLVAADQISAMTPATIIRTLTDIANASTTLVFIVARTLVKKLMVSLPGDCSISDSLTTWSPAGAAMYLVWAFFDSMRAAGCFSNIAIVNAFPPFPKEAFIPVAWAQLLQYCKPFNGTFVSAQWNDTTYSALPTAPTNNSIGPGGNGFCVDTGDFAPHPFAGGAGAEASLSAGVGTTWTNLFTYTPYLSAVFARGMACVRYDSVPNSAPDASAYVISVTNPQAGTQLACFTPKFHPEIAYFFRTTSGGQAASTYSYLKPVPAVPGNNSIYLWWVECFQLCPFLPGVNFKKTLRGHVWNRPDFVKRSHFGRIKVRGSKGKSRQPVRFLFGGTISLDTRTFQAMIGQVLFMANLPTLTANDCGVFAMICMSALIAKVTPWCYDTTQTSCIPSGTFDNRFKDIELPVAIAAILNTINPICVDGRMRYPTLFSANSIDLRGSWLRFSTVGNLNNTEALFSSIYGGGNTVLDVNLMNNAFIFSAANFATTTNYGSTPMMSTDLMIAWISSRLSSYSGNGNTNLNLVKPDAHNPVGKSNLLVFADVSVASTSNVPTLLAGLTARTVAVTAVGSFKHIAGDELGAALVCPLVYPVDYNNTITTVLNTGAPFRASGTSLARSGPMTQFCLDCAGAGVGTAIAQGLGVTKRKTVELGGSTVDVSQNGDFFGAIVDTIVGPLFGDAAADTLKSGPIGALGRGMTNWMGGPVVALADEMGVVDGVVSSFGLNNEDLMAMAPMALALL